MVHDTIRDLNVAIWGLHQNPGWKYNKGLFPYLTPKSKYMGQIRSLNSNYLQMIPFFLFIPDLEL